MVSVSIPLSAGHVSTIYEVLTSRAVTGLNPLISGARFDEDNISSHGWPDQSQSPYQRGTFRQYPLVTVQNKTNIQAFRRKIKPEQEKKVEKKKIVARKYFWVSL